MSQKRSSIVSHELLTARFQWFLEKEKQKHWKYYKKHIFLFLIQLPKRRVLFTLVENAKKQVKKFVDFDPWHPVFGEHTTDDFVDEPVIFKDFREELRWRAYAYLIQAL